MRNIPSDKKEKRRAKKIERVNKMCKTGLTLNYNAR